MASVANCDVENLRNSETSEWAAAAGTNGDNSLEKPEPAVDSPPPSVPLPSHEEEEREEAPSAPAKSALPEGPPPTSPSNQPPPASPYDSYSRQLNAAFAGMNSATKLEPGEEANAAAYASFPGYEATTPSNGDAHTTTLSSGSVSGLAPHAANSLPIIPQDDPNDQNMNLYFTASAAPPRSRRRGAGAASSPKVSLNSTTSYVPPNVREMAAVPPIESDGSDPKTNLQYTVTVCKRSNGNQPWEPSNVQPPMLGKMRRMTVQFAPFTSTAFEVLFQCKDLKPDLHEGRLVVSANDRGIARNASTLPSTDENLFRTVVQPNASHAQAITVYLKPCWRGFGSNRERPVFSVTVAVRPAERECAFVILHSWNVELHSHKMESSAKGKTMDANGPFEVRGTVPLHVLEQPARGDPAAVPVKTEGSEGPTPSS